MSSWTCMQITLTPIPVRVKYSEVLTERRVWGRTEAQKKLWMFIFFFLERNYFIELSVVFCWSYFKSFSLFRTSQLGLWVLVNFPDIYFCLCCSHQNALRNLFKSFRFVLWNRYFQKNCSICVSLCVTSLSDFFSTFTCSFSFLYNFLSPYSSY